MDGGGLLRFAVGVVEKSHLHAGGEATLPAVAGYPHIIVPMGSVFGLPVGLSFFGRAWSEPTLVKLAFAFEQATKHRKAPKFLKTADLTRAYSRGMGCLFAPRIRLANWSTQFTRGRGPGRPS